MIVRTKTDRGTLTATLRETMRAIDPDVPLYQLMTPARVQRGSGWNGRVSQGLVTTIASIALALSAIGLLATSWHAVAQRGHELGIRIARRAARFDHEADVAPRNAAGRRRGVRSTAACRANPIPDLVMDPGGDGGK